MKYKIVFGNCVSVRTGLWNTSMRCSICAKGEKKLLVNTIWWTLNGNLCRVTKMIWDRAKSIFQVFPVTYIGSVSKRLGRLCASPHLKQHVTIIVLAEAGCSSHEWTCSGVDWSVSLELRGQPKKTRQTAFLFVLWSTSYKRSCSFGPQQH